MKSVVLFDVAADTPHKVLTGATDAGLVAAREALAGAGSVDANGSLGSAREGVRRVRIELTLRAPSAPAAMEAERAFSQAFLARIEAQGFVATHV